MKTYIQTGCVWDILALDLIDVGKGDAPVLIQEKDRKVIREMFAEGLQGPVKLVVFTEGVLQLSGAAPCPYCKQTVQLVEEVAGLSDQLSVEVVNFYTDKEKVAEYGIARIPAVAIVGAEDYGVRYYGIPAGYEFTAFIEDIMDVSKGTTDLAPETKEMLARIDKPMHIQVFVTPTCPYCPPAVRFAHKLAIENPNIKADMVESQEFPELASHYNVFGVPRTVINEDYYFEGAMPEQYAILHVLQAAGKLTPEEEKQLAALAR